MAAHNILPPLKGFSFQNEKHKATDTRNIYPSTKVHWLCSRYKQQINKAISSNGTEFKQTDLQSEHKKKALNLLSSRQTIDI